MSYLFEDARLDYHSRAVDHRRAVRAAGVGRPDSQIRHAAYASSEEQARPRAAVVAVFYVFARIPQYAIFVAVIAIISGLRVAHYVQLKRESCLACADRVSEAFHYRAVNTYCHAVDVRNRVV